MAYEDWNDVQLVAELEERAQARGSTFSIIERDGNTFAVMEQQTPIGVAIIQSAEGADRQTTLVSLLQADDLARAMERGGGPRLGG